MTVLTPAQITQYARAAGFRGPHLTWAVAVALAESGGRTDATYTNSDKYHSVDRGLWQINNHWHPEVSDAQAFDPAEAAKAAYRISNGGTSWSPWSTYKNGHARAQYARAQLATHPRKYGGKTAAGGSAPATSSGTAAPSPKAPGVGSTGGGSTPGNTLPSTTTSLAPTAPGAQPAGFNWGGAASGLPFGLGGALLGGLTDAKNPFDVAKTAVEGFSGIVTALFDPHTYVRAAYIGVGAGAVLLGAYLLAKSGAAGDAAQGAARTASSTVKTATKAAALA